MSDLESLRERFENLADDYVLSKDDIDMVPAVLGARAGYSYGTDGNGHLLYISAYDQAIETVADLRRLTAEHPRSEDDSDSPYAEIVQVAMDHLFKILDPIYNEVVQSRLRLRVLHEMMTERDPDFAVEFQVRFLAALGRDYAAFRDGLSLMPKDEYEKRHADWIRADQERSKKIIGVEKFALISERWEEWIKQHPAEPEEENPAS